MTEFVVVGGTTPSSRCVVTPVTLKLELASIQHARMGGLLRHRQGLTTHEVAGQVFDADHDLAEEVPDEMADVVLPFLAAHL
jgi:hypothetical protein